jgi:hypothetical protein
MSYTILDIVKVFWLPTLIILIPIVLLFILYITDKSRLDKETLRVVLGVMLGVMLGFASDIAKRSYDDFIDKDSLRKASFNLLKEDAKRIYQNMWMFDYVLNDKKTPEVAKEDIPPALDMRYWSKLKMDNKFLIQAADEPFNQIFKLFGDLEYINDQITLAEKGDKAATYFAKKFYRDAWRLKVPKKLVKYFMNENEFIQFEIELKTIAEKKD